MLSARGRRVEVVDGGGGRATEEREPKVSLCAPERVERWREGS